MSHKVWGTIINAATFVPEFNFDYTTFKSKAQLLDYNFTGPYHLTVYDQQVLKLVQNSKNAIDITASVGLADRYIKYTCDVIMQSGQEFTQE